MQACRRYPSCEPYFDQLPQGLLRIGAHTDFEVSTSALFLNAPGSVARPFPACVTEGCELCAGPHAALPAAG